MKKFTFHILFTLIIVVSAHSLFAQPMRRTPEERAKLLTEQLSLTVKQEKQVLEIYREADKKREAMFGDMQGSGDRDQAREKMMSLFKETDTKIEKVLTTAQKKKFEALKKERRQRMGERRG